MKTNFKIQNYFLIFFLSFSFLVNGQENKNAEKICALQFYAEFTNAMNNYNKLTYLSFFDSKIDENEFSKAEEAINNVFESFYLSNCSSDYQILIKKIKAQKNVIFQYHKQLINYYTNLKTISERFEKLTETEGFKIEQLEEESKKYKKQMEEFFANFKKITAPYESNTEQLKLTFMKTREYVKNNLELTQGEMVLLRVLDKDWNL